MPRIRSRAGRLLPLALLSLPALASSLGAQLVAESSLEQLDPRPLVRRQWYSGDTHEHIQQCDDTVISVDDLFARMEAEDLDLASVLIWHRDLLPYTQYVCEITGSNDFRSNRQHLLRFGVETSGLSCARWGHLIAMGVGRTEARVAFGLESLGDCADMPGLGLGGDGSGSLNAPIAEYFYTTPGVVCGYAHVVWTSGLYHRNGYDWTTELLGTGFTTDTRFLEPGENLAVPKVSRLFALEGPPSNLSFFIPPLGPMDLALGHAQFVETIISGNTLPINIAPPGHWNAMYYKLSSAGVRIGLAGGSDRACFPPEPPATPMRTYVRIDAPLDYEAWGRGLAEGHSTISDGNTLLLRLTRGPAQVGDDVYLVSPEAKTSFQVVLESTEPLTDTVELVAGGELIDSLPVTFDGPGRQVLEFANVPFAISTWVAARLGSQRAHTAAIYLIVDGRPISDPRMAEYWMLWCDIVTKTTLDNPDRPFFGLQQQEALDRIAKARRCFKALRDLTSFDPAWPVWRYGTSTPGSRGPIGIGIATPPAARKPLLLTCVNAPPNADGELWLSLADDPAGSCDQGVRSFLQMDKASVIGTYPAQATRSGYAEVTVPELPEDVHTVYAQFRWTNPPGYERPGCEGDSTRSASDALRVSLQ